jgi:hypothetical protein
MCKVLWKFLKVLEIFLPFLNKMQDYTLHKLMYLGFTNCFLFLTCCSLLARLSDFGFQLQIDSNRQEWFKVDNWDNLTIGIY